MGNTKSANRIHCAERVRFLASQMRLVELDKAECLKNILSVEKQYVPALVTSAVHDVLTLNHDRDIRTFSRFLLQALFQITRAKVCVLEISVGGSESTAHVFNPEAIGVEILFLVAYR